MGMSVKGLEQHRLIAKGMTVLMADLVLTEDQRADCERLRQRADLAIERLKKRKRDRAARYEAERA